MALLWLVMHAVGYVFYVILGTLSLIIGFYPTFSFNGPDGALKKYPGLPVGRLRVYPWHVILTGVMVLVHYESIKDRFWALFYAEGAVLALLLIVCGFLAIDHVMSNSEYPSIIKEYALAKKSRFCPTVEFDHPTQTQVGAPVVPSQKLSKTICRRASPRTIQMFVVVRISMTK